MRSASWPRRSGARPNARARIARPGRCSSSTWRWGSIRCRSTGCRSALDRAVGTGPAGRPRLAGPRLPGPAPGPADRGAVVARRLPAAPARRSGGLARPARMGDGRRPRRRGPRGAARISPPTRIARRESTSCGRGSPPVGAMPTPSARPSSRPIAADPGDVAALERLAELARAEGTPRTARGSVAARPSSTRHSTAIAPCSARTTRSAARSEMARLAETPGPTIRGPRPLDAGPRAGPRRPRRPRGAGASGQARARPPRSGRTLAHVLAAEMTRGDGSRTRRGRQTPATAPRRVVPLFRDDAASAGLRFTFNNGADGPAATPRGVERRRRPARLRRRRPARRLSRPGRHVPPRQVAASLRRPPVPQPGQRDLRGRHPRRRDLPRSRAATGTASPSATTTTTAAPISSSPDGDRMRSTTTGATGRSRTRPRPPGLGGDRDWPTSSAFADLDGDGDLDLYVCHYLAWDAENPEVCRSPASGRVDRLRPPAVRRAAGPPVPQRRRPVRQRHEGGGDRRPRRPRPGRRRRRPRRRRPARPVRRQRRDGQLPVPQPRRLAVRGGRPRVGRRGGRRRRLSRGDGGGPRRPGRRRPARPGGHQLLRRVNHVLPEPRRRPVHRPDRGGRPGGSQPLPPGLRHGLPGRRRRRPARPPDGQRPHRRRATRDPLRDAGAAHAGRRRTAGWRTSAPRPARRSRCPGSAAAWPSATWTTTAASTRSSWATKGRSPTSTTRAPAAIRSRFRLEGTTSNRDAVGARVTVEAGGRRQVADRFGGGSYQSASDPRLHFGLGAATRGRTPSRCAGHRAGSTGSAACAADAGYLIREGDPAPRLLPGHAGEPSRRPPRLQR